ncbi:MAG TPA: hypothetical protein VKV37_03940 [Ktedonobacteraceae bacterium]|nr:hypothetical protein [Ktedonobacteraceae bacterium]
MLREHHKHQLSAHSAITTHQRVERDRRRGLGEHLDDFRSDESDLSGYAFGLPVRISTRVSPGRGSVLSIEREARLSGPIHAKGVLTLAGYLAGQYAQQVPLSMAATLTFEQSYVNAMVSAFNEVAVSFSPAGGIQGSGISMLPSEPGTRTA